MDLIENDEDEFVLCGGSTEKFLDRRIVVFLLSQHGDEHVGRAADLVGPVPVDSRVAVDVRRVEHQQVGRHVIAGSPEQNVLSDFFKSRVGRGPVPQFEVGKDGLQFPRLLKADRHQADGMFRSGGQGTRRARPRSRQMIEDDRLAEVRSPDDGRDQEGRVRHLRQQLLFEELKPLRPTQPVELQDTAAFFKLEERSMKLLDRGGTV